MQEVLIQLMGQVSTKAKFFRFKLLISICLPVLHSCKDIFEIVHSSKFELEKWRLQVLERDLKLDCL
jgi:hypothetical protein